MPVRGHGRAGRSATPPGRRRGRASRSGRPIHPRLLELIRAHRSTLIFVNSRRARRAARRSRLERARRARTTRRAPTTARSRASSASRSRSAQGRQAAGARAPRRRSSSASTWARSTSSSRSSRRRRSRAACSAIGRAGHQVGARQRAAGSSRSTAATCSRRPSSRGRMREGAIEQTRVPAQPARRPRPADRRMARDGRWAVDDLYALVRARRPLRRARRDAARGRARHAVRPLPVRRVRRAAAAAHLGPRRRHRARRATAPAGWPSPPAARSPTAGSTACSWPTRRRARRRARRGDGLREPLGRDVPARRDDLADRGDHARPGARLARARRARARCRSGTATAPGRPSSSAGRRRVLRELEAGRADGATRCRRHASTSWPRQPARPTSTSRQAATGVVPDRPHDRGRALPRRARRLAGVRALAVRRPRPRAVGARASSARMREALGYRGRAALDRRRHRHPPAGRRRRRRRST